MALSGHSTCSRFVRFLIVKGWRFQMTMPDDHYDYITGSVAGLLTLFIILGGIVLVAAWLYAY
jgi:hypothetical protein